MATGAAWERGPGWVLWLTLALTWFATLQIRPLLDPDEGRYAEIPREMVASGDWVTPRLDGLKYFEKPPLQYWATAAAYTAFGLSEATSRVWEVGLAFLCLPMVYAWGCALYGRRAGLVAVAALASSPYFVIVGHLNLLDPGFTLWLTGALFAFTLAQNAPTGSSSERRWMLVTWAAAALAVLSKGIVVGVLAGLTLVLYSLLERDGRPWRRLHLLRGLPLFLAICAPWFIAVTRRNPEFPEFFFVHEHFARFLTTVHQRVEPWWYFLPLLLLGVAPWSKAAIGSIRRAWFDPGVTAQFRPQKFLLIFAAVTLVFFSLSGSKLAPYILPMMPALAAIVGAQAAHRSTFMVVAGWVSVGLLAVVGVGLVVYAFARNGYFPDRTVLWAAGGVLLAVLTAVIVSGYPAPPLAPPAMPTALDVPAAQAIAPTMEVSTVEGMPAVPTILICAIVVLGWQCLLTAYSYTPPARSARNLAAIARQDVGPRTVLYTVGQYRHTLSAYLRRTMIVVGFTGELEFGLQQEPGRQSATSEEFLTQWRSATDAVAFFSPPVYDEYRMKGFPGRVLVSDGITVVVSRNETPDALSAGPQS